MQLHASVVCSEEQGWEESPRCMMVVMYVASPEIGSTTQKLDAMHMQSHGRLSCNCHELESPHEAILIEGKHGCEAILIGAGQDRGGSVSPASPNCMSLVCIDQALFSIVSFEKHSPINLQCMFTQK